MVKLGVSVVMSVAVCLATGVSSAADLEEMAGALPRGANTVLVIDAERVLSTEMARANDWGNPAKAGDRPTYLPPEATQVIVASQVDPANKFAQAWEAAVVSVKESLPMRLIARAEGGYTDRLGGKDAAWVPSDAYFIQLDEEMLGIVHPANRQAASRWVSSQGGDSSLSPYLQEAVRSAKSGAQIVLALDALDAMPAHRLHESLSESEVVTKNELDVEEMVNLFSTMKGVTLEVTISDQATARAQVQFGEDVPFGMEVARDFVLGAMTNVGAEIPGVEDWLFTVSGDSIFGTGKMDVPALRRVLSLLEIPTTKFSSLKDEDTDSEGNDEEVAAKSLVYFQTVDKLISDLQSKSRSSTGDSVWMDRYAKRIERLPILNVDQDLLDFGQNTTETLRVMSGSRKSAIVSQGVARTSLNASNSNGNGNGYGYSNYNNGYRGSGYSTKRSRSNARQNTQIAAKNRLKAGATSKKLEGFRLINNAVFEIRRTMTERYKIEF